MSAIGQPPPNQNNPNNGDTSINGKEFTSNLTGMLYTSGIQFLLLIMPYIIISFFLLLTFFNNNLKGITYFIGILLLFIITNSFSYVFRQINVNNKKSKDNLLCRFFGPERLNLASGISVGTLVYIFTLFYLLIPMIYYNIYNISIIITFLLLTASDFIVTRNYNCTDSIGFIISISMGALVGILWSFFVISMNNKMLYHTDYVSNKLACSMPEKQNFKCEVYKDGQLIAETTA